VAYTPSITQAAQTREQLKGRWLDTRTIEVLHRGWHIDGQSVRPDHRMVAHTGFLTAGRFLGQGANRIHQEHDAGKASDVEESRVQGSM
ncbi:MAG: tRNA (adenine-N1)-methyltransferase, partial [Actinomycetota bacterium]|nr:tRNA (adenine-N1)-methyltransferase [Actinomycetota bacterium]